MQDKKKRNRRPTVSTDQQRSSLLAGHPLLTRITTGLWLDQLALGRASIYSWLMNNFWYTNFPGYQLGNLRFRFSLTSGRGSFNAGRAERFGRSVRVGLAVV